jgi:hypothetical protein
MANWRRKDAAEPDHKSRDRVPDRPTLDRRVARSMRGAVDRGFVMAVFDWAIVALKVLLFIWAAQLIWRSGVLSGVLPVPDRKTRHEKPLRRFDQVSRTRSSDVTPSGIGFDWVPRSLFEFGPDPGKGEPKEIRKAEIRKALGGRGAIHRRVRASSWRIGASLAAAPCRHRDRRRCR